MSTFWLRRVERVVDKMMRDALREAALIPSERSMAEAANAFSELMAISDIEGRLGVRESVGRGLTGRRAPARLSKPPEDRIPAIRLSAMLAQLRRQHPTFAPTAEAVADIYRQGAGFAAAHAASVSVADRVRDYIIRSREAGIDPRAAELGVQAVGSEGALRPWSRSYAATVYRTNVSNALTGGMLQESREPAYMRVIPAWRYRTAGDVDVRNGRNSPENHKALDDMLRAVDWQGWSMWLPPGGYNCRCTVLAVSAAELRRRRLIDADGNLDSKLYDEAPAGARFHSGFQPKTYARI